MSDEKRIPAQTIRRLKVLLVTQHHIIPAAMNNPSICADVLRLNQLMREILAESTQRDTQIRTN